MTISSMNWRRNRLHGNLFLTIYDTSSASSKSYQGSVTIDPRIPGTVYGQLGTITLVVYGKSLSVYAQTCVHKYNQVQHMIHIVTQ